MSQLQLTKYYSAPFVLDKSKLARISSVLSKVNGKDYPLSYSVNFKTGRQLKLPSLEDVLSLDNALTNPILKIVIDAQYQGSLANVEFNDDDSFHNVTFRIFGGDNETANELYGSLDEQADRTLNKSLISRLFGSFVGRVLSTLCLIAALIGVISVALPLQKTSPQSFESTLIARARTATSDHEKLQIVFEKTIHDLQPNLPPVDNHQPVITTRSLFLALPAVIVASVLVYMMWTCYPRAVFAWGDWEQRYREILARRRALWTVVIGATIFGIVSNLFVVSLPVLR